MATFNSPKTREVNLALYSDGSWKIISDLPAAEISARLEVASRGVADYVARVAAGEQSDEDDEAGVTVVTTEAPVAALGQV